MSLEPSQSYLSDISVGETIQLVSSDISQDVWCRLCEMGLTLNTPIKIIRNKGNNPLLVKCRNSKIMVSRELSQIIQVEELEEN